MAVANLSSFRREGQLDKLSRIRIKKWEFSHRDTVSPVILPVPYLLSRISLLLLAYRAFYSMSTSGSASFQNGKI